MAAVLTEKHHISNVITHEFWETENYCLEEVIVNEATAKSYLVGTVLGEVTATGKYKIAVQTAVDGSATAAAIVRAAVSIPATTDTKLVVLRRGPAIVKKNGLVLDATYNLDAEKQQIYDDLTALGIKAQ